MLFVRDYISPTTLRIEFGIANEMKQYEDNVKVRRVLGSSQSSTADQKTSGTMTFRSAMSSASSALSKLTTSSANTVAS